MSDYKLESCGGMCPTQADGRTGQGRPFYFRARYGSWSLRVGEADWPTNYALWPGDAKPGVLVAHGEDPTSGCMSRDDVEAILELHLEGR